ncbi:MAG TPA: hypothetical protein VFF69_00260 [Phycisphaerales bacterium]|nr:hypothetical protein [Phycisphaerales bacterium]
MSTNFCTPVNTTPWSTFPGSTFNPAPTFGAVWHGPQSGYGPNGWWFGAPANWSNQPPAPAFNQWNAWNGGTAPWQTPGWHAPYAFNTTNPWSFNQIPVGWNTTPWFGFNPAFASGGNVPSAFAPFNPTAWHWQHPVGSSFIPSFGYATPGFTPWSVTPSWGAAPNTFAPGNAFGNTFGNTGAFGGHAFGSAAPWQTGASWSTFPSPGAWYAPAYTVPTGYTPTPFANPSQGNAGVHGANFGYPTAFPGAFGNGVHTAPACSGREAA